MGCRAALRVGAYGVVRRADEGTGAWIEDGPGNGDARSRTHLHPFPPATLGFSCACSATPSGYAPRPRAGPPDVPFREIFGSKGWREKITSNGVFWVLQEEKNTSRTQVGNFFGVHFVT